MASISQAVFLYVNYKLDKAGYRKLRHESSQNGDKELEETIVKVCSEFEERLNRQFSDTVERLAADLQKLDRVVYFVLLDNIVADGINWGRVVALIAFTGTICVTCMEQGLSQKVNLSVEWATVYMDQKVKPWTDSHGGLDGFLKYFKQSSAAVQSKSNNGWGTFLVGAIGFFTVGVIPVQKT